MPPDFTRPQCADGSLKAHSFCRLFRRFGSTLVVRAGRPYSLHRWLMIPGLSTRISDCCLHSLLVCAGEGARHVAKPSAAKTTDGPVDVVWLRRALPFAGSPGAGDST